jgi:hypothetical protein
MQGLHTAEAVSLFMLGIYCNRHEFVQRDRPLVQGVQRLIGVYPVGNKVRKPEIV